MQTVIGAMPRKVTSSKDGKTYDMSYISVQQRLVGGYGYSTNDFSVDIAVVEKLAAHKFPFQATFETATVKDHTGKARQYAFDVVVVTK